MWGLADVRDLFCTSVGVLAKGLLFLHVHKSDLLTRVVVVVGHIMFVMRFCLFSSEVGVIEYCWSIILIDLINSCQIPL